MMANSLFTDRCYEMTQTGKSQLPLNHIHQDLTGMGHFISRMKRAILLSLFLSGLFTNGFSQVSVSEDGSAPDGSAILEAKSSNKGFLPPRLTTEERDNISSPADGLVIFNSTKDCIEYFTNNQWYSLCGTCPAPAAPASAAHSPGEFQITWNWNTVAGADGYKYNTVNNYASATDNGTSTTFTQTDLGCNTEYTLYIWSYSSCGGNSMVTSATATTTTCSFICGNTLSANHVVGAVAPETKSVAYGTVLTNLSGSSKCWITQNLGADNQATAVNDGSVSAAGWYWQFNRKQGYKRGNPLSPTPSWMVTSIDEDSNWLTSEDPCRSLLGPGWRIPTASEWESATGNWSNHTQAYASVLKLHTSGRLEPSNGESVYSNIMGQFWFGTQSDDTNAKNLYFDIYGSYFTHVPFLKNNGYSVRCIKD